VIFRPINFFFIIYRYTNVMINWKQPSIGTFFKMIAAIKARDWNNAASEALRSRWSQQVGDRATEIADMLRRG
jgi:lysozyme